jgi:hypothetical protein
MHDLKAGDELMFSYIDTELSYTERQAAFKLTWEFQCICALCMADSHPRDNHARRIKLMSEQWPALRKIDQTAAVNSVISIGQQIGMIDVLEYALVIDEEQKLHRFVKDLAATYHKGRKAPKMEMVRVISEKRNFFASRIPGLQPPNVRNIST